MLIAMPMKFVPIKGQKFDLGRTINFTKCNCEKCDFLNCNNYSVETRRDSYTVKEWVDFYRKDFVANNKKWSQDLFNEFFDSLIRPFPKGLYWDSQLSTWSRIRFIRIRRSGKEREVGYIRIPSLEIVDIDLSLSDENFLNKVVKKIKEVEEMIINE